MNWEQFFSPYQPIHPCFLPPSSPNPYYFPSPYPSMADYPHYANNFQNYIPSLPSSPEHIEAVQEPVVEN